MAYAFDKVDDYFRRNKQGGQGSLQRGTTGAPPPTAATEQGTQQAATENADTSAFRANQGASQAAAQSALTQPAQRQAQAWEAGEQQKAGQYKAEGEKKIGETYKAWNPESIAGIEAGNQDAMSTARQQVGYTGKEMTFQPYQARAPQLDTTSMLRGGVGGLQAALQKGKGGRYTAGMGALDASLMAGNKDAMQGLQAQLGDVYQGARAKREQFEQTDEGLTQQALEKGTGISKAVKDALSSRSGELQKLADAQAKSQFEQQMGGLYGDEQAARRAQAQLVNQTLKSGRSAPAIAMMTSKGNPDTSQIAFRGIDPTLRNVNVTPEYGAGYQNLMSTLGQTPAQAQALTGTGYGFDRAATEAKAQEYGMQREADAMNFARKFGVDQGVGPDGERVYSVTMPNGTPAIYTRWPDGREDFTPGSFS
jgi:hypothetical protein